MTPKIVLYLRLAGQTGRNKLQGVFRYLRENRRKWDIRLPQTVREFFAEVEEGDIGGVITSSNSSPEVTRWVERASCPVVFLDVLDLSRRVFRKTDITVRNADDDFGRMAVRHFVSIGGFASYGYVRAVAFYEWDRCREKGFCDALANQPRPVSVFADSDPAALVDYLAALPKPAAVYAAWDERARDVVAACKAAHISIPKQVAVLGTDDDAIVCTLSSPELSSIRPDTEGSGYLAAKLLDQQIRGVYRGREDRRVICLKPKGVMERESTRPPPPGKRLVDDVLSEMASRHDREVTPESLARKFHCSRRILDMRFAQFHKETIGAALRRIRLEHVVDLLRNSSLPITDIGPLCGFDNDNALKNLFRRTYGMSMREFR